MPHQTKYHAFFCNVVLVAVSFSGPAVAQSIEIVSSGGSRVLILPEGMPESVAPIRVSPTDTDRAAPFHVAPQTADPIITDQPASALASVTPEPAAPMVTSPLREPLDVDGQRQRLAVVPSLPDVGLQIAEALARDEVIRLPVNFDFDSANIRPESLSIVETIADALRASPDLEIEVQGHTDDVGTPAYNQELSERRANEVRRILIETYGIAGHRITALGLGMSLPVDPRTTEEARAKNRRVEIHYRN